MIRSIKHKKGFTLVELLVCITIFVIMTALLVVKYGNFNQNVLLTNLAYDTALAMRTAQNYGLSVKSLKDSGGSPVTCDTNTSFQCAYGVAFYTDSSYTGLENNTFVLFADIDLDGAFNDGTDQILTTYTLKRGATIFGVCGGDSSCTPNVGALYVTFKRPDPNALVCTLPSCPDGAGTKKYGKITIRASNGDTRSISVRSNGQISVDI